MHNNVSVIPASLAVVAALSLVACGGLQKAPGGGNSNAANNDTGYQPPADYPQGPYGVQTGATIADIGFTGVANPDQFLATNGSTSINTALTSVHLSDFRHKVPVLVITAAAVWCEYCNMEEPSVVSLYNSLNGIDPAHNQFPAPTKLGVVEALINNNNVNQPADSSDLKNWAGKYHVTFDLGLDPNGEVLNPYYQQSALPMHMLITTADMKIQDEFVGQDDTGFASAINALLQCATLTDASSC